MPDNTVEATLLSRYQDGISEGIEKTSQLMEHIFSTIEAGASGLAGGVGNAFNSIGGSLAGFRTNLNKAAEEAESDFKRISLAAIATGVAFAEIALGAGRAIGAWIVDTVKESSRAFEVKTAFEALTSAAGIQASVFSGDLKKATEGQISGTNLLRNANKILSSEIPITTAQYTKLVESVFRLAKAAGADGAQAQDTLTNALIRGNARGFQAIGIHINVKDAITQQAEATGEAVKTLGDHTKLQAFYNDLIEKTEAGVTKLGEKHQTLEDILVQADTTFKSWVGTMGVSILRSGVFQDLLEKASQAMLGMNIATNQQTAVALTANEVLIWVLQTVSTLAEWLGYLSIAWDALKGIVVAVWQTFVTVVGVGMTLIAGQFAILFDLLSQLPGKAGAAFVVMAERTKAFTEETVRDTKQAAVAITHAFDGFGSGNDKLQSLAATTAHLAEEAEKLRDKVVRGEAGFQGLGDAANKAAGDMSKLQAELLKAEHLMDSLNARSDQPEWAAIVALRHNLEEIASLTLISAEQRARLVEAAIRKEHDTLAAIRAENNAKEIAAEDKFSAEILKETTKGLQQDIDIIKWFKAQELLVWGEDEVTKILAAAAAKREAQRVKEVNDAISAANAIDQAYTAALGGKLDRAIAQSALRNLPQTVDALRAKLAQLEHQPVIDEKQIQEILKLKEALEKLNNINLTGYQRAIKLLKDNTHQMAQQVLSAWEQLWSDLVSGQQDAGRKFVAALINMVADQIKILAVQQVTAAIASAANLDYAGATRHAVAAAALGAAAGALSGFASAIAGGGSSASTSTGVSTAAGSSSQASSTPTQVLRTPNAASPITDQNQTLTIKLQHPPGTTSDLTNREYQLNGGLRLRLQRG